MHLQHWVEESRRYIGCPDELNTEDTMDKIKAIRKITKLNTDVKEVHRLSR